MVKHTCNSKESSSRKYSRNIRKPRKKNPDNVCKKQNNLFHSCSKKVRVNNKKNTIQQIIYNTNTINVEKYEEIKDVCVICCESSSNIKYINCKRGGLQNVKFGRYGKCCGDKPICWDCRERCRDKCPFCNEHELYNTNIRMRKKKKPFIERKKDREKKQLDLLFRNLQAKNRKF
jgi:hypothetical protein